MLPIWWYSAVMKMFFGGRFSGVVVVVFVGGVRRDRRRRSCRWRWSVVVVVFGDAVRGGREDLVVFRLEKWGKIAFGGTRSNCLLAKRSE